MAQPLRIFISYAHVDKPFKERLISYLTFLKRKGLVEVWHDGHIDGGDDWRAAIEDAMNDCTLALMLVSDAFLASEFIHSHELHQLLGRRETDGIRVVPIILRPCFWEQLEILERLQALPDNGRPIITFPENTGERDQAWTDITRKIAAWAGMEANPASIPPLHQEAAAKRKDTPGDPFPVSRQEDTTSPARRRSLFRRAVTEPGGATVQPVQPSAASAVVAVNPYNPWNEAISPCFFGRRELLRRLGTALDEKRSVSLVGDWRIGKTSVLRTWQRIAESRGRTVRFVSGLGPDALSCAAFVKAICGRKITENANPEAAADAAADMLVRWVKEVSPAGLPPLILIDDDTDAVLPRLPARFFERLRGMLGAVCLVIATRREIDKIYQEDGRTSPLGNQLEMQRLGLLEAEAAEEIIALGVDMLNDDDRELMRCWAGRHPYYLALLGRRLWDARHHDEDIREALEQFKDEAYARLRELWNILSERDQQGLRDLLHEQVPDSSGLKRRGLLDGERFFGKVLETWLKNRL